MADEPVSAAAGAVVADGAAFGAGVVLAAAGAVTGAAVASAGAAACAAGVAAGADEMAGSGDSDSSTLMAIHAVRERMRGAVGATATRMDMADIGLVARGPEAAVHRNRPQAMATMVGDVPRLQATGPA